MNNIYVLDKLTLINIDPRAKCAYSLKISMNTPSVHRNIIFRCLVILAFSFFKNSKASYCYQ